MKRFAIIVISLVLISQSAYTQKFKKGLLFVYNSSKFVGKDIPGNGVSLASGIGLGGFVSFGLNEKFSIRPEFTFSLKGSKINTFGKEYLNNYFLYFDFPVLVKYSFRSGKELKPYIIGGSSQGIKITAANDNGVLEDIRQFDWGAALGSGVDYKKVSLGIRYYQGLLNFDQSSDDINLKNSTYSIVFSIHF